MMPDRAYSGEGITKALHASPCPSASKAHFLVDNLDCAQDLSPGQGRQLRVAHILEGMHCLQCTQESSSRPEIPDMQVAQGCHRDNMGEGQPGGAIAGAFLTCTSVQCAWQGYMGMKPS